MTLATARELAADLGVHRRTIYAYMERDDFPAPAQQTTAGALWDLDEVRRWQQETAEARRPGRPRKEPAP